MSNALSIKGSLPDQLPIAEKSSTGTQEEPLKAVPPTVLIKKRKSSRLQTILKPKQLIRSKYFTCNPNINEKNARHLKNEPSPFEYTKDIEEFAHKVLNSAWRNDVRVKELEQKVFHRPSYRDRQKTDLLNRLYVKEPCMVEGKTVLHINPNYYSVVGGRPIPDKFDIREYIKTVRDSLRIKIVTGYREDDIMVIEETMKLEQKMIDIIQENLQSYINTFEEFLIIDHRSAMELLREADSVGTAAYDKYSEHKSVSKKYAFLRSSLYSMEEKWKSCKTYQKFLYNVSPLTWRMQQENRETQKRRTSIYMMEQKPDDMLGIFGNFRTSLSERGVSLEDIINEFREEILDDKPPRLYFSNEEELLDVFRFIEMQNLNSLLYSEELAMPLTSIKEGMISAVILFDKEIKQLQENIATLEGSISNT